MCVICNQPDPDHVGFWYKKCWAAPVCCDIDWDYYFFFLKSCTTASAPSSYRSGTCLAAVTFLGIALGFRLMSIGSPLMGSGFSSSLNMLSNSDVNPSDNNLTVVLKENSSLSFNIVFGNPCGIGLISPKACHHPSLSSQAPLSFLFVKLMSAPN